MKKFFILPLIAAFLFFGFTKEIDRPKLVVFIVCDQATPEILKKYGRIQNSKNKQILLSSIRSF